MSRIIPWLVAIGLLTGSTFAEQRAALQLDEHKVRLCCECICVPHYPDPYCFLGDCITVAYGELCPAPYIEPADCPVDDPPTVPPYLQPGDILFCQSQNPGSPPIFGWDHVAIYVGNNEFVEAVPGEPEDGGGVRRVPLSEFYTWATDITYGYVDASAEQREYAVAFAEGQRGKHYQDWTTGLQKDPDPDSTEWYCSELVWAAYYNAEPSIEIDRNGWQSPAVVWTWEISLDDDVEPYFNEPPDPPARPSGRTTVLRFALRPYSTSAIDPENNEVLYRWDWDLPLWGWTYIPRPSGQTIVELGSWSSVGSHNVRVKAMDVWGDESSWSQPLTVTVLPWFGDDAVIIDAEGTATPVGGDSSPESEHGLPVPVPESGSDEFHEEDPLYPLVHTCCQLVGFGHETMCINCIEVYEPECPSGYIEEVDCP